MLHVNGHRFIKPWEPFAFDGLALDAEVHADRRGRTSNHHQRNVFLTRRTEDRQQAERNPQSPEVTRLSYLQFEGQRALFIGMSVNTGIRRAGIGKHLFDYFLQHIGEEEGIDFVGTGKLHKPGIALIARKSGLVPKSTDCIAEVMPPELALDPDVPLIRMLKHDIPDSEMKDRSCRSVFYETADPGLLQGVPVNPDRLIALHTGYRPPLDYCQIAARGF
jgi:hypothetical protein